ncbi:MAG: MarR family transcriptional regulator [Nanoarchaeota archaeon]|nr:MarR family transcriptional regulator [Nanoarchaeota archaeon]
MQPLEQVLGSKNKITLLRFLSHNNDWQFNLSEISKKIGLDKGTLSRLIKEFEKKEIIEIKRSGKLLLFKLNEKNETVIKSIIPLLRGEEK